MNKVWINRVLPPAFFIGLALLIMGPLLRHGYILHFDMVFTPHIHIAWESLQRGESLYSGLLMTFLLKTASLALPMDVVQKLILTGILFAAGYLMYLSVPVKSRLARLFAGFIYVVNPFVYDRFMAGHWLLLLAYALTPLVLMAFWRLFSHPDKKSLAQATAIWSLVAIISPHHLIILGILYIGMAVVLVRSRRSLLYGAAGIGLVGALALWWLLPMKLGPSISASFSTEMLYAFATRPDAHLGLLVNMLSLQGFWHQGWQHLSSWFGWWPLLWILSVLPVMIGLAALKLRGEAAKITGALILVSLASLFIVAGPSPATYSVNTWLFQHLPGFSGLREPGKALAMVALAYAFIGGVGVDIAGRISHRLRLAVAVVAFVTGAGLNYFFWWGAHGQLATVNYPESWGQFYDYLSERPPSEKILVLPWQQYVEGGFAGTLVANPAATFFGERTIQSNQLSLPNVHPQITDTDAQVAALLQSRDISYWTSQLQRMGVRYLLITRAKEPVDDSFLRGGGVKQLFQDKDNEILMLTK